MSTLGNRYGYLCPCCGNGDDLTIETVTTWLLLSDTNLVADVNMHDGVARCLCGWCGMVADLGAVRYMPTGEELVWDW